MSKRRLVIVEPFYGGSHRQLVDFLALAFDTAEFEVELHTLPAKKWQWRARTAAIHFFSAIPESDPESEPESKSKSSILLCSSVLNLSELVSLRPDLSSFKKLVYFHENQLYYPLQTSRGDRDFQFGYSQILSALVADCVIFNSKFNRDTFLDNLDKHFAKAAKPRPKNLKNLISGKSRVIYFPVHLPRQLLGSVIDVKQENDVKEENDELVILWPHRWEHDKNAECFFRSLYCLKEEHSCKFRLRVLGESFEQVPQTFDEARVRLESHIEHWGFVEDKQMYWHMLKSSDLVVSTSNHEFFGVAIWEAVQLGCFPLLPNRLVYPELYPKECLYGTETQLVKRLRSFCKEPSRCRRQRRELQMHFDRDLEKEAKTSFTNIFNEQ